MPKRVKVLVRDGAEKYIPFDVVKHYFPRISGNHGDYLLWNMTAYPFNGADGLNEQVRELAERVRPRKRGWLRRLATEHRRMDAEMAEVARRFEAEQAGKETP